MAISYAQAKLESLEILDAITDIDLMAGYGRTYNAKTALFKGLGIPPERMAVMAPIVNTRLKAHKSRRRVSSFALVSCKAVGDFIKLYCGGLKVTLEKGEPT